MTFQEKIKSPGFFKNFLLTAVVFFVLVTLVSLILSDAGAFFSFDFDKISEINFSDGKWERFFGVKIAISVLYSFYLTLKKTK